MHPPMSSISSHFRRCDQECDPDLVTCAGWLEAGDRRLGFQQIEVVSPFVLVPAHAAAIGYIERFDAPCDLVLFHGATIRSSPHGASDSARRTATPIALQPVPVGIRSYGMLHHPKAAVGDPVPQILRQWLQAWRTCFTAPSWEHVLVLVMGALLAPGKRTVSSCLRMTNRVQAGNFATYHQILNRAPLELPCRCQAIAGHCGRTARARWPYCHRYG